MKMMRLLFIACAAINFLLPAVAGTLSVEITGYDSETDEVSFAFTGVERDLSLFALWDDGDKGTVPCAYAETWSMGTIAAGTTSASVALPAGLDASKGCVRFVLADFGGATPVRSLTSTAEGKDWIDTEICPTKDATITVVCRGAKTTNMFGIKRWFYLFYWSGKCCWGNGYVKVDEGSPFEMEGYVKRRMTVGPAGAFVDGVEVGGKTVQDPTRIDPKCSLALFARRDVDAAEGVTTGDSLAPCTIFSSEVVEKDLGRVSYIIPCLKDGVAQMYDMVNRRFLTNRGTGQFEVDRTLTLNFTEPLDGLVAVSDVLTASVPSPARAIAVKSVDWETGAATLTVAKGRRNAFLYVANASFDAGLLASSWSSCEPLAEVAADAEEVSCIIPEAMLKHAGVVRFFLSTQPPEAVPVYEWLIPEGDVYVDTGYCPKNTDMVMTKVRSLDADTFIGTIFSARDLSVQHRFAGIIQAADRRLRFDRQNISYYAEEPPAFGRDYDIVADFAALKVTANGEDIVSLGDGPEERIDQSLWLLASQAMTTGIPQSFGRMRLAYFRLKDASGAIWLDLVPTMRDGVACLYDIVSSRYLKNSGTGSFSVGSQVDAVQRAPKNLKFVSAAVPLTVRQPKVSVRVDAETGRIDIRLGAHERAGRLFVAGGERDFGNRLGNWSKWKLAGAVSVAQDSLSLSIPESWQAANCKVFRAFFATGKSDFCAVEGLVGDGREWIDTGILPDEDTTVTVKARVVGEFRWNGGIAWNPIFGIERWLYLFTNGNVFWGTPGVPNKTGTIDDGGKGVNPTTAARTYRISKEGAWIDDEFYGTCTDVGVRTTRPACSMTVFVRASDMTTVASGALDVRRVDAEFYWGTVERGGRLVSDLRPCLWKGTPCLYDRVRKLPLKNAVPEVGGKFTTITSDSTMPFDEEILGVSAPCPLKSGFVIFIR